LVALGEHYDMSSQLSMNVAPHSDHSSQSKLSALAWLAIACAAVVFGLLVYDAYIANHEGGHESAHHVPPIWACFPFALLLLSIAVLPLISATEQWWERNLNRLFVSLGFAAISLCYYIMADGVGSVMGVLQHAILNEYVPFIVLLFALYVISGGISLRGDLAAHPTTNVGFLAVGALSASLIGTTGASMLLIRPLLQTNSERKHVVHTVIFFIFLVSNVGGSLLPIGDPPLFLGYLRGVPFLWTLNLFVPWIVTTGALLAVYYVFDTLAYRKEAKKDIQLDETRREPLSLKGNVNFVYLLGIVLCVAMLDPSKEFLGLFRPFPMMREMVMLGLVGLSLKTTPGGIRKANQFNYHAIIEVAALFIGIFICMQIPIAILHEKGADLGLSTPMHFFWATGGLSAFLDNAPTYVVFFETAKTIPGGADVVQLTTGSVAVSLLKAISLGAVFMGAMSYIGNGPNFMVKSIAEQSGIKMPSFFGYMVWSVCILGPVFVVVTMIFL
jgi:Na+/H+ antiporter NhaD/arsenite permease-like protein